MNTELLDQPIRTDLDLRQYWIELMSPLGFSQRRLYFIFLDHQRRAIRQLHEIDDLPETPDAEFADAPMAILSHFADSFSFALLLARPGRQPMDANDRAWARTLIAAGRRAGIELRRLHFANHDELVPFAPDDLIGSRPGPAPTGTLGRVKLSRRTARRRPAGGR